MNLSKVGLLVGGVLLLFMGCTTYVIDIPLETLIETNSTCRIGSIVDDLPFDMELEKKPTMEEVMQFKECISDALTDKELFAMTGGDLSNYVIQGGISEFKRGNGVLRFFFGILADADARLVVDLSLVDKRSDEVVFAGQFRGEVTSWTMPGSEMYKITAKSFAKALTKEMKRLKKELING